MFIDNDFEQQFNNSRRSSYKVTYDDDSTETISAGDAYVDGEFVLFIDVTGLVARGRVAESMLHSVISMSRTRGRFTPPIR